MKELFDTVGPIIQQGAYAAVVVLFFVVRHLLKENATLRSDFLESQKARISSAEVLTLVIERNTVATAKLGELVHDLSEQAIRS